MDIGNIQGYISAITLLAVALEVQTDIQKAQQDANFDMTRKSRALARLQDLSERIDGDITALQAEKASYLPVIAGLPVGNTFRAELESKVVKIDYRLFILNERKSTLSTSALIKAELDYQSASDLSNTYGTLVGAINAKVIALT